MKQTINAFAKLPASDQIKFNKFNVIRFDLSILEAAAKSFCNDKDSTRIVELGNLLSNFIQNEVLPLIIDESDETENN